MTLKVTRGKIVATLLFVGFVVGPIAYVYGTQGLSSENVATGGVYVLVLTLHPNADPDFEYCTIRVKKGNSAAIDWIYIEGDSLARNITFPIEWRQLAQNVTQEGGSEIGFRSENGERLWRNGDRVHILLRAEGRTVDLGTVTVRMSSLQADDYVLLAAYVVLLSVVAVFLFPRLSAFLDIVTSRAPSPGVSNMIAQTTPCGSCSPVSHRSKIWIQ